MSSDDGQTWTVMGTASDAIGTNVTSLVEGPDGRMWLGDYDAGLSVLDGRQWRHLQR
jgi:ligand-binding sensor domain-containing protein